MTEEAALAGLPSFKCILLVTDFSACSELAVPCVRRLAELYRPAAVVVAHVIHAAEAKTALAERQIAEVQMRQFLAANPLGGVPVESLVAQGSVGETVGSLIQDKRIDLVVVGTHGRSGVGKLLLGSVAQRIFNTAVCPVLSVSLQAHRLWSTGEKLATILYATDFSADSLHALLYALSLASTCQAKLLLLHAPSAMTAAFRDDLIQQYQKRLNALVPREAQTWCKSDALVIPGEPADVILQAASDQNADVIVIGGQRVEGTINVPLSTAYRVVAHAHCPVLRVRSDASGGEEVHP